ncbi:MAG: P22 coat protein - protein 5 domain protein [Clostridia bacterium]|nr:P22 coat protein - protein 5 domain protein [Clostridia bacterium]
MAITNFIPTVWSEALYEELQNNYVGVKLSSREYEGEIKTQGDRVKINGLGPVTVFNYTKNTNMPAPEVLSDNSRTLVIDQAKGFNFCIDSIDDVQSSPKLIQAAMKKAADALSDVADKYIYSLEDDEVTTISCDGVTKETIVKAISDVRRTLMEHNVPNSAKISLEVPPAVEQLLVMANVLTDTNNSNVLSKGYIGKMFGFDIYVTNNIELSEDGRYKCIARTDRAIAFAEQINSIKPYEPELRNGTAVKGLHLYGAKIVYPKEMVFLDVSLA